MIRKRLLPLATLASFSLIASAHDTEEEKVLASDGAAGDLFGSAVSVDDTTMIVGAPGAGGIGAAYVFVHDGTSWVEEAKLTPSDGAAGDDFGHAVSVHGDHVIVGAPGHDSAGADAGAAYIFVHSGGVWSEDAKLTATGAGAGDEFGVSVSMEHDHAAIGAPREAAGLSGSAFVFSETGGVWSQAVELFAADATAGDEFGFSVKLGDETLLVGSPHSDGPVADTGAAYVFDEVGGVWSQTTKLAPAGLVGGDHFGIAVARSGLLLTIGASGDDTNGSNAGARYNMVPSGSTWVVGHKALGTAAGNQFGGALSSSGKFVVVGQANHDGLGSNAGDARLMSGPALIEIFVASDPAPDDQLGCAIASSTCWVAVGACGSDTNGAEAGAVYTYLTLHGSATTVNGNGINPVVMTSTDEPNIGAEWEVEVDVSGFPTAIGSSLYVYRSLGGPTPTSFGEILLDTSRGFISLETEFGTGLIHHHFDVPNDPFLIGFTAAAQAVVLGPSRPLALTNAEDLLVGCSAGGSHHTN